MSERRNNVPPKKPKKVNTVKSKSPSSNKFKKLVGWRDENGRIYADASKIKVLHSENKIDYVERNPNSDFEAFPDTELEPTLPAPELPPRPEAPKRNGKLIAGIIVGASLMVLVSIALIFILPRILNSDSAKQNTNNTTGNTFAASTSETTTAGTTRTTVSETVYTDLSAGDDDTSSFNGHKYQIIEGRMTWTEAEAYCEGKGGHLATITSKEEQEYILNLNSSKLKLWIGGYKDGYGNWNWITGERWGYTNWADREPNNDGTTWGYENYTATWPESWNDLNENNNSQLSGFICEWDDLEVIPPDKNAIVVDNPIDLGYLVDIGSIYSSTEDNPSYGFQYPPYHLMDDDRSTSWAEGRDDDGIGEYIVIPIPKGTIISGIVFHTGYCKSIEVFEKNGAPSAIDVSSGNVKYRVFLNKSANDYESAYSGEYITFPSPIVSDGELRLTIAEVRLGTMDWHDTNMSEIQIMGEPAP